MPKRNRSAKTGELVSEETAAANPDTTVAESDNVGQFIGELLACCDNRATLYLLRQDVVLSGRAFAHKKRFLDLASRRMDELTGAVKTKTES